MKKIIVLFSVFVLASCVSLNKNDSRYIGNAVTDNGIAVNINDALLKTNHEYVGDVNVTVFNGRVMLVGAVASEKDRNTVLSKVRAVNGVKSVINHLELKGYESGQYGFDSGIHKLIVGKLLTNTNVASNNFKVVVFNKIAYVLGEASSVAEMNAVLKDIKETSGVIGVRNNIIVK